jgi:thymidylate kinase
MALFLSIEGIECTGKTAVTKRLAEIACAQGINCTIKPEFPAALEHDINEALSKSIFVSKTFPHGPSAAVFFMLYGEAISLFHCADNADLVIADRYIDSIAIYQRRFLPPTTSTQSAPEFLLLLESLVSAASLPIPDFTVWLDVPIACVAERFARREKRPLSKEESDQIRLFQKDYADLVSSRPRFKRFDATQDIDTVANSILQQVIGPALRR